MILIFVFFQRSTIYASRLYLNQYNKSHPERLASNKEGGPKISGTAHCSVASLASNVAPTKSLSNCLSCPLGNVYIHPTANIDPTAVVSIIQHDYFMNAQAPHVEDGFKRK